MKKLVAVLLAVFMLGCSGASAEGLLPQFDDVFGIEVPSMANSLGREPDSDIVNEDGGQVQTYGSVTEEDYQAFSNYLTRSGCTVSDYSLEGSILHVSLNKDEIRFTLDYDIENQQAVITYPSGVRVESFDPYRVGATVSFGKYEQDGNKDNGPEPIEWIVIFKDNDEVVLMSRYILDAHCFNNRWNDSCTWEVCDLRVWLNDTFLNSAFGKEEREQIVLSHLTNPGTPNKYARYSGRDTDDYVYLLSLEEIGTYFDINLEDIDNEFWEHNDELAAWPTQFAIENGCIYPYDWNKKSEDGDFSNHEDHGEEFKPYTGAHRWWLRTMSKFGDTSNYACDIEPVGAHDYNGIVADEMGIRPVIRIKVTK